MRQDFREYFIENKNEYYDARKAAFVSFLKKETEKEFEFPSLMRWLEIEYGNQQADQAERIADEKKYNN